MAETKTTDETTRTLDGTELVRLATAGANWKVLVSALKTFFSLSPTLVSPALGTPTSGVATNLTGTASGLTAGTVTTNANLTGNVTSVGNATTLDQTAAYAFSNLGTTVVSGASFGLSGAISAPAWTTSGIRYKNVASTLTDTTSSGTVAAAYTNVFGANTIAASSATTFTNYYNSYFLNPVAGTNVTLTNKAAIGADSIGIGGAAQGTDALSVVGTSTFAGGTVVASAPVINVSQTWNNAGVTFTGMLLNVTNTASNSASLILDVQKGGSSIFSVRQNGNFTIGGNPGNLNLQTNSGGILLGSALDISITRAAANSLQFGPADAATAVAQTTRVQSVVAGTAAANGANWTLIGSLPTGTGTSGDIIFQTGVKTGSGTTQGTATTALTIKGETQAANFTGNVTVNNLTAAAGGSFYLSGRQGFDSPNDKSIRYTDQSGSNTFTLTTPSGAATLQFGGLTTATAAVAQTLQVQGSSGNSAAAALFTIAGSDQAGTTTTGGGIKIRGGNGTTAGGTVEIWTSATTTPAVAATFTATKQTKLAGNLWLDNALVTGLTPAVSAGLLTKSIILYDNTGAAITVYGS